MFAVLVEMWSMCADDEFDLEYCGEFLWADGFSEGTTILFEKPGHALEFMSENKTEDKIPGFEYRYRIQPVDNSDGAFDRDQDVWE